jgi:hypothetical protein
MSTTCWRLLLTARLRVRTMVGKAQDERAVYATANVFVHGLTMSFGF